MHPSAVPAVEVLDELPQGNPMFTLGDVKVRPTISQVFGPDLPLWAYQQVYNAGIDQESLLPGDSLTESTSRTSSWPSSAICRVSRFS